MSKFVQYTSLTALVVGLLLGFGRVELLGQGGTVTVSIVDFAFNPNQPMTGKVIVEQQEEQIQELALIHSLKESKIFPEIITVRKGVTVQLFNTALDGVHPPVAISSDEDGKNAVFGIKPFNVQPGQLTVVKFTPDKTGTFFITHKPHGHNIVGKLVVVEAGK